MRIFFFLCFFFSSIVGAAPVCKFVFRSLRLVENTVAERARYDYQPSLGYLRIEKATFEYIRSRDELWLGHLSFLLSHSNFHPEQLSIEIEGKGMRRLLPTLLLDFPEQVSSAEIQRRWRLIETEFAKHEMTTRQLRSQTFAIDDYIAWVNEIGVVKAAEALTTLERIGFTNIYLGSRTPANLKEIYPLDFGQQANPESQAFQKVLMYFLTSEIYSRTLVHPDSKGWTLAHRYAQSGDLQSLLTLERLWPSSTTRENHLFRKPTDELSFLQKIKYMNLKARLPKPDEQQPSPLLYLLVEIAIKEREANFPPEMKGSNMLDSKSFRYTFTYIKPVK